MDLFTGRFSMTTPFRGLKLFTGSLSALSLASLVACASAERERQELVVAEKDGMPIFVTTFDSYVSPSSAQVINDLGAGEEANKKTAEALEQRLSPQGEASKSSQQPEENADDAQLQVGVYIRLKNLLQEDISALSFKAKAFNNEYEQLKESFYSDFSKLVTPDCEYNNSLHSQTQAYSKGV